VIRVTNGSGRFSERSSKGLVHKSARCPAANEGTGASARFDRLAVPELFPETDKPRPTSYRATRTATWLFRSREWSRNPRLMPLAAHHLGRPHPAQRGPEHHNAPPEPHSNRRRKACPKKSWPKNSAPFCVRRLARGGGPSFCPPQSRQRRSAIGGRAHCLRRSRWLIEFASAWPTKIFWGRKTVGWQRLPRTGPNAPGPAGDLGAGIRSHKPTD
jgi:hypothetical protein